MGHKMARQHSLISSNVRFAGVPSLPSLTSRSKRQSLQTGTVSSFNDDTVIGGPVPDTALSTAGPGCSDLSSSLIMQLSPSYPCPSSSSVRNHSNRCTSLSLTDDVMQEDLIRGCTSNRQAKTSAFGKCSRTRLRFTELITIALSVASLTCIYFNHPPKQHFKVEVHISLLKAGSRPV